MTSTFQAVSITAASMTGLFTFIIALIKFGKSSTPQATTVPTFTREDIDNARMDAVFQTTLTATLVEISENMKELHTQSVIQTQDMQLNHRRIGTMDETVAKIANKILNKP